MSMFQATPSRVKVSAVPPILKHMLVYGFIMGIVLGLIGQFIIRDVIEKTLAEHQTIPMNVMQFILYGEVISIILIIALLLLILRFRWQAPSWKAKFAHGFSIAFVFVLASHIFTGTINGALHHRDLWDVFFHTYSADDPVFLDMLSESIWNTIFEGMRFRVVLLTLIPFVGGLLSLVLLRRNPEQSLPEVKDMFGSLAVILMPTMMYISMIINGVIYIILGEQLQKMNVAATLYDVYALVPVFMMLPPLVMVLILQLFSIVWIVFANVHTVHRAMLRVSQIFVVTIQGILIIPLMNFYSPGILGSRQYPFYLVIGSVGLAWVYGIAVQWKLYKFNRKKDLVIRANGSSLVTVSFSVISLSYLLADYFTVGISRNLVIYSVEMIPEASRIETTIQAILHNATINIWFSTLVPIIIVVIIITVLTTPVLWIANLSEK